MRGLTLEDELEADVWFVRAKGYLDANTAEDLDTLLEAIFAQGVFKLALDLSHVTFMSSAGAGILMVAYKRCESEGGGVVFVSPSDQVAAVFKTLGLDDIFRYAGSRADAARALA